MPIQKVPINLVLTRYGRMLYLPTDQYVGQSLDQYAEFSPEEGKLLHNIVQGKNVIEVGANMGALTLPLAAAAKQMWAYEPQAFLARLLHTLPLFNKLPNLTIHNKAVGSEAGAIWVPAMDYTVTNNYGGYGESYWQQAKDQGDIQMLPVSKTTIDDDFCYVDLPLGGAIDFIKIDVEGMELDVLKGAANIISRCQPVMYIENDRPEKSEALVSWLADADYTCYWHTPALFTHDNFAGNQTNIFPGIISYNILCIPSKGAWFSVASDALRATPDNPKPPTVPVIA